MFDQAQSPFSWPPARPRGSARGPWRDLGIGTGVDDAIAAGSLDWANRNPFDRMLVSQRRRFAYRIATRNDTIQRFPGAAVTAT